MLLLALYPGSSPCRKPFFCMGRSLGMRLCFYLNLYWVFHFHANVPFCLIICGLKTYTFLYVYLTLSVHTCRHIRSRPGFKYKFHGLPDNNAFWPGALLDKLRLWHPSETLQNKPCSLYNIFQPVQHPKIYNPHSPVVEQKTSWPENESGYVQFGSESRKRYHM